MTEPAPLALKIVIGSTREGRAADLVAAWLIDGAQRHGAFAVDVLDLRDWPLPIFQETVHSIGDHRDPTYSEPIVRQWNQRLEAGDAFLFLTPEYNHSISGVLKNAIDNVFVSYAFRNKPAAFAAYSTGLAAGVRAIEHLAHIMIETDAAALRNTVIIPKVTTAFEDGHPIDPTTDIALDIMLDDLAWWGHALRRARREGELPPGTARLRAALAPPPP